MAKPQNECDCCGKVRWLLKPKEDKDRGITEQLCDKCYYGPTPTLEVGRVHGRNDKCGCGSGKKYKKCCLLDDK